MASEKTKRESTAQGFDCDSLPIAPGTKNHARLPRDGEPEPMPTRMWWLVGAAVVAALIVGVLIGRLL